MPLRTLTRESFANADSVVPSRTIASSTTRLCGGKEGRPLGLKHVALRIADALSLVGTIVVIVALVHRSEGLDSPRSDPRSPRAPLTSTVRAVPNRQREGSDEQHANSRRRVEDSVNLAVPVRDGASHRVRRRAGGRRVPPRRVQDRPRRILRGIESPCRCSGSRPADVHGGAKSPGEGPTQRAKRRICIRQSTPISSPSCMGSHTLSPWSGSLEKIKWLTKPSSTGRSHSSAK